MQMEAKLLNSSSGHTFSAGGTKELEAVLCSAMSMLEKSYLSHNR